MRATEQIRRCGQSIWLDFLALRKNSEKWLIGGDLSVLPSWDRWLKDSGLERSI
jgi:hypothetical protein